MQNRRATVTLLASAAALALLGAASQPFAPARSDAASSRLTPSRRARGRRLVELLRAIPGAAAAAPAPRALAAALPPAPRRRRARLDEPSSGDAGSGDEASGEEAGSGSGEAGSGDVAGSGPETPGDFASGESVGCVGPPEPGSGDAGSGSGEVGSGDVGSGEAGSGSGEAGSGSTTEVSVLEYLCEELEPNFYAYFGMYGPGDGDIASGDFSSGDPEVCDAVRLYSIVALITAVLLVPIVIMLRCYGGKRVLLHFLRMLVHTASFLSLVCGAAAWFVAASIVILMTTVNLLVLFSLNFVTSVTVHVRSSATLRTAPLPTRHSQPRRPPSRPRLSLARRS